MDEYSQFLDYDRVAMSGGVHDSITGMAAVKGGVARIGIAHLRPEVKECSIEIDTPNFQLQSARQFLDEGWRDIEVNAAKAGGGVNLTLPIGGSGLTILTGSTEAASG